MEVSELLTSCEACWRLVVHLSVYSASPLSLTQKAKNMATIMDGASNTTSYKRRRTCLDGGMRKDGLFPKDDGKSTCAASTLNSSFGRRDASTDILGLNVWKVSRILWIFKFY